MEAYPLVNSRLFTGKLMSLNESKNSFNITSLNGLLNNLCFGKDNQFKFALNTAWRKLNKNISFIKNMKTVTCSKNNY